VSWIWSDELATAAESAGLDDKTIATWRRQPVAFLLPPDASVDSLVRRLLGVEPPVAAKVGSAVDATCSCGGQDHRAQGVLAPEAVDR